MPGFPVIAEARLLDHGEQLIVAESAGRGPHFRRGGRFVSAGIHGSDFVGGGFATGAEEVFITSAICALNADNCVGPSIGRAVNLVVLQGLIGGGSPTQIDVPVVAFGSEPGRNRWRMRVGRWVVDLNVVKIESVGLSVIEALHKRDMCELVRIEGWSLRVIDQAVKGIERKAQARPFSR